MGNCPCKEKPMAKTKTLVKLHAAAFLFSETPDISAAEIATRVGTAEKTLYTWRQTPEWHAALDALGYDGDRSFRRKPRRDTKREAGALLTEAETLYIHALLQGKSYKQAVTAAATALGLNRPRVEKWRQRYGWITQIHAGSEK